MRLTHPAAAVSEYMRALGWYESHLFGHYYLRDHWCVGIWPGQWSLSRRSADRPGTYLTVSHGATLAELKDALRAAAIPQEETKP